MAVPRNRAGTHPFRSRLHHGVWRGAWRGRVARRRLERVGRLAPYTDEARAFASSPSDIACAGNTDSPAKRLAIMAGATDGVPTKAKLPIWSFERACVTILLSDWVRRTSALTISAGSGASRPERLLAAQSGRMLPPARRSGAFWTRSICSRTLVRKTSHKGGELDLCSGGNEAFDDARLGSTVDPVGWPGRVGRLRARNVTDPWKAIRATKMGKHLVQTGDDFGPG